VVGGRRGCQKSNGRAPERGHLGLIMFAITSCADVSILYICKNIIYSMYALLDVCYV